MLMEKIYQPIVIEKTKSLIEGLKDSYFFEDYEITNFKFVENHLCDVLTEKFISGELSEDVEDLFSDDEFEQLLREIVAGSILYDLKDKGIINSYKDDDTEEMFFLTEKGKKIMKKKGLDKI